MNFLRNKVSLILFFILTVFAVQAQLRPIPVDPAIRYGKLENGLTYYIRHNENPKNRAEFYLAQNVGAILENDDQDGLAHFLEHMAFNGTKNFPDKGIIDYFETIGVKFGSNINAYTALDQTVYNLSNVPTTREGIVDTALLVLHDWSGFLTLDDNEIDNERGVIREEWRTRQGAERRIWKESNKLKYPGSKYADRDIIGDTAVINNFEYQALRSFYEKWYRPDLQAVLVVGDVDVDTVEAKIKELFTDIPRKANYGERPVYPVYNNEEPIVAIVTDPEASVTRILLEYKHDKLPAEAALSVNGYLVNIINSLISNMLTDRFNEMTLQADAPFVGAYAYYGELVKSKDAFVMLAVPHEGRELEGLRAILLEAEKMNRYGFTNSELERAKTGLLKQMEKAYNERGNQRNNSLVQEYIRHYLTNEPIPGIEWEYETLQVILPQISLEHVNQIAQSYITDENMIVSVNAPDKKEVIVPSEEQVLLTISESKQAEIFPRKEDDLDRQLISSVPKAGKIRKETQNTVLGVTEWQLSNGVKVVFKPTEFKQDEILLSAFSEGGLSKVENNEDIPSAVLATNIVGVNGLGGFSAVELQRMLTGKIANVSPYIDNYEEGFSGLSSVTDFETMLQLLYLHFTSVRKDDNAFQAMMNMYRAALVNKSQDPRAVFSDSVAATMYNHNPRVFPIDLNTLELVNQDKALAVFKDRFANPADFTFVFTGNIDPANEQVRKAVLTYLGGIKSKKIKEEYVDRGIAVPEGRFVNHFTKDMQVKKSSVFVAYTGNVAYNIDNRTNMLALTNILNMRYLESIREKEGGSYGVRVSGGIANIPSDKATLQIQFDTDPEKQEDLMKIVYGEIDTLLESGPRADDLQKVKEILLKQYAEDLNENSWWINALSVYYQDNIDFPEHYKESVERLTSESVQSLLRSITDQQNIIEVVMSPVL